jgi:antitoxin Phd
MRTISATEAKQNFAALIDSAQREPIVIRRHNRDLAVVVSPQEFDRIRGVRAAEYLRKARQIGEQAVARGMNEQILERLLAEDDEAAAGR